MRSKKNAYVVATDFANTEGSWHNPTGINFLNAVNAYGEPYPQACRFFFDEKPRQVTGKFEDATLYETFEAAENAAFLLVCLDPNLADHVKPMLMMDVKKEVMEAWHRKRQRAESGGYRIMGPDIANPKPEDPKWEDEKEKGDAV